ncbi:hypothetical protein [Filifactor villosus]|uniref:Uncharacterized protein n=1 Tax=Filifactor villosus TaxID=29374 RepID=A0ABV9QP01_9FIRM
MKRSIAFFVATVLIAMPITKVYAFWTDKLDVDLTAMFIYPTEILVEEDEQLNNLNPILPLEENPGVIEGDTSTEQTQPDLQTPEVENKDLLQSAEETAPVQDVQNEPIIEEQVETEQGEINNDAVSEEVGS